MDISFNLANNNDESEPEDSDEDELIKDIANNFSAVEKTGPQIDELQCLWFSLFGRICVFCGRQNIT